MLTTIAGGQAPYSGAPAIAAAMTTQAIVSLTVDNRGNVYFFDNATYMLFRMDPGGRAVRILGNGLSGDSPDGPATQISLVAGRPALTVNRAGELIFSDGSKIRKLLANGLVQTLFREPNFSDILHVAVDAQDRIYYSTSTPQIMRLTPGSDPERFAGNGLNNLPVENASATESSIRNVGGIAIAPSGAVYFLDSGLGRVRVVSPEGILRTVAGIGERESGDDGPAITAGLGNAMGIALHPTGDIYVSNFSGRIRRIRTNGTIEYFAGTSFGFSGDNGPATGAAIGGVDSMAFDSTGNLFLADTGRVRRIDPSRRISTVAGGATSAELPAAPPWATPIGAPGQIAVSNNGAIAILSTDLLILSVDGVLRKAAMKDPSPWLITQMAFDPHGTLHIAHRDRISRVNADGSLSIVAGGNGQGLGLAGIPALQTKINAAGGLAFSPSGELYFSDSALSYVRRVDASGIVRAVSGEGSPGFAGDLGPAITASLRSPSQIAFDTAGNLFVADSGNNRIRRIAANGTISTIAGTSEVFPIQDQMPATQARLSSPTGLAIDTIGSVYVLERGTRRVRRINPQGTLTTITAPAVSISAGAGPQLSAFYGIENPASIAVDRAGRLLIADSSGQRVIAYLPTLPSLDLPSQPIALSTTSPTLSFGVNAVLPGVPVPAATASPSWLTITQSSRVTPSTLQVTADYSRLPAGRHSGNITIGARTVAVTMDVPELGAAAPNVDRAPILFRGSGTRTVFVRNTGAGSMNFRALTTGTPWLSVSPATGQSTGSNPGAVLVSATTGALEPGVYTGGVQIIAEDQTINVPVTLVTGGSRLRLLNKGLSIVSRERGPITPPRALRVESDGAFQATASTLSGGNWLNIGVSAAEITVTADPSSLSPGDYYGEIRVTAPNSRALQVATVVLKILPRGSTVEPTVSPLSIATSGVGDSKPPSNDILVYNPYDEPLAFSISNDSPSWIEFSPQRAVIPPGGVARIVVQTYASAETPVRRTYLNFSFSDGSSRAVELLVLTSRAGCASRRFHTQFTAFDPGDPAHVEVRVTDECGQPAPPNTSVALRFSSGEADAPLHSSGGGLWTGTWNPARAAAAVTVTATAMLGVQMGASDLPVTTAVASEVPIVRAGAIVHGASQRGDVPMATATLVTVYGANLAGALRQASGAPLPTAIDGTQVLIGGEPMPLLFVSPNQINAQISPGLIPNQSYPIVVRRGQRQSSPETLAIAPAQPGIFTLNQSGSGQGIVLGPDQLTLADSAAPAERGKAIIVYGTGFGPTTFADGLPRTQLAVTVSVGGVPANVLYSGLTAGFAGLYQVNAVLGESTPVGGEIPVAVTAGGRVSNTVTIAVK